jgi:hypothetical protein
MNKTELYNLICNARIKDSIFLATKMILKDQGDTSNFDTFIQTCIAVCSYIGSYISVYDIKLWLNVIRNLQDIIDNENIVMKDIYVLITKLCIICDIYVKQPVTKTGTLNIKLLRDKIIHIFSNSSFKLSETGSTRFEGVLPPVDSQSYNIAIQVITGYVYTIKEINLLCPQNNFDKLADIANNIRLSFDYIIRKKYVFETKFYTSDNDGVWFLWGIISLLYNENEMNMIFQIFSNAYTKKNKIERVGLLWGAAITMVYVLKKDIARDWNKKEMQLIMKIEEISLQLLKDIKRELIDLSEIQNVKKTRPDGLDYICNVCHFVNNDKNTTRDILEPTDAAVKTIKYKQ